MKSQLILHQGGEFQRQGTGPARFVKDVVSVGKWKHPITGQEVVFTPERLTRLVDNTQRYLQNVDRKQLPFPDGHSFRAQDNLGYVDTFLKHGDSVYAVFHPTAAGVSEKLADKSIRSVSALIDFNVRDSKGNEYDEVFTHVCATPYPVLDGQKDFQALSRDTNPYDVFIPESLCGSAPAGGAGANNGGRMDLKKLAVLLGLAATATETEIEAAAHKQLGEIPELRKSGTSLATITAALEKDHGIKLEGDKLVKLSAPPPQPPPILPTDSPEVKAMKEQLAKQSEELAAIRKANAKSSVENAKALAETFIKSGQVPPALRESLSRLLTLQGKATALQLSADGSTVEQGIDAANEFLSVLKGLPAINQLELAGGKPTPEQLKLSSDAVKAADDVVKRLQPSAK